MPKNKGKGGKNLRRGKRTAAVDRGLIEKKEGQDYAQVKRALGNLRVEALCSDGKTRLCIVPGHMKKKQWVNQGDIVLINLRDYQDDKADISLRYTPPEVRQLKRLGLLPSNLNVEDVEEGDDMFEFTKDDDEGENSDKDVDEKLAQPSNAGMMPPSDDEVDLDDL
jgi:initiation factor 1A